MFYVFPSIGAFLGRRVGSHNLASATDLAAYLVAEHGLAVVAGEDFGAPHSIRISYATSMENLREGMDRLQRALGTIAAA